MKSFQLRIFSFSIFLEAVAVSYLMEVDQCYGRYIIAENYFQNGNSLDFSDVSFPWVNSCKVWSDAGLRRLSYFRNERLRRKRYKNGISVEHNVGASQKN